MKTNSKKDTEFVMIVFALISLVLIFTMINNFRIIDCCYFIVVLVFATRYMILCRR